ncbi:cell envelope integrity protein CreD [Aurantiacibacter sp. MUD11]|uniref:cell envelope integrity protein CreD n=1 Tax=Aurantiacibacter sp. MUD11 TaxID=3003265 RepID=UPI0022AAB58C|nr:cell envelope integrity protein CreD [Aurantiacibacter sp. MUD11]WAT18151.1 cell envelope integrity protein CreD [Aurantiacibacter sp. MUD11]
MKRERSPGMKLLLAGLVAAVLIVPLMLVYALVYDRESQSERAQAQITQGWGGAQTVTGPVLVLPFTYRSTEAEIIDGTAVERTRTMRSQLFVSPTSQSVETSIDPDRKGYAIYESVVYQSRMAGTASFDLPTDLERLGVEVEELLTDQAELRFGVSDPRGLTDGAQVTVGGEALQLQPGNGPASTGGSGFSANVDWNGEGTLEVSWEYGVRGTRSLALIPRGGETEWRVTSPWPHPSFTGSFLPDPATTETGGEGFTAVYPGITNLALGRGLVALTDDGPPSAMPAPVRYDSDVVVQPPAVGEGSMVATIALVDPVDLYSQVDRAVKYGFLFIGFTFAAFLMFDIVGGARVASAEYLLTGAGLVLFFVMLLAFAEIWGFALAYVVASAAIIGLLTTYSAAVLGTWRRASFIGLMLAGLYALLFVLLNLETYSLVIGSLLLFAALAGIMYATRSVDWTAVGRSEEAEGYAES